MAPKKIKSIRIPSARSEDQPATRKMLSLVRDELSRKMESGFGKLEARMGSFEARMGGFEARFLDLEAGNSRMQLLFEEQNANNRIVLEGLQALWQRQDSLERRLR